MKAYFLPLSSLLAAGCFAPNDGPLQGESSSSSTAGISSSSGTFATPEELSSSTSPKDVETSGGVSSSSTGHSLHDDSTSTGEGSSDGVDPQDRCRNACDPKLTSSCTADGSSTVVCEPDASGCFAYEIASCVDGVCVPDIGCVYVPPASCMDILDEDPSAADGVYLIDVDGLGTMPPFEVRCDMTSHGGGWTLVARNDETATFETFDRDWVEYKEGFGDLVSETRGWLGNDRLHRLTDGGHDLLVIHDQGYHRYADFSVADEASSYQLLVASTVESFDAGVFAAQHNGLLFTTRDVDNDMYPWVCAETFHSGWWYDSCYHMSVAASSTGQVYWRNADGLAVHVEWIEMWVR